MSVRDDCRVTNFFYGAVTGTILAFIICGSTYALNVKDPPLGFNMATVSGFINFVSWEWFFGIVAFVALIGFVFNVKLVYTWSDVIHWFD